MNSPPPDEADRFLRRHHVLLRKARDISHQVLFFLGLLEKATSPKTNRAVADYRPFGLEQVRALVRALHLPEAQYEKAHAWAESRPSAPEPDRESVKRAVAEGAKWKAIYDATDDPEADAAAVRRQIEDFLNLSAAPGLRDRVFHHHLPGLLSTLRKHLTLLWGAAILFFVVVRVEAVWSLVLNEGWRAALLAALLAAPFVVARTWVATRRRTRGEVPFWDVGGPGFWSVRYQALEPGRLVERWPSGETLRRRIVIGHLIKFAGYLLWWGVVFVLVFLAKPWGALGVSGATLTVFLVLSLCYVLLIIAHFVDFWDFLDPQPVRFIALLIGLLGFLFLLKGWGSQFFAAAFLLVAIFYAAGYLRHRRNPMRLVVASAFLLLALLNFSGWWTHRRDVWSRDGAAYDRMTGAERRLESADWPWAPPGAGGKRPPVVVLAASGGGSRAALYTALTLQRLNEEFPQIAEQLQAISSVSGGSLANAVYVARLLAAPKAPPRQRRGELFKDLDEAVGQDFLLPTLAGALIPTRSRGKQIEQAWHEEPVSLGDTRLGDLAARWREAWRRGDRIPPFPVPLFNSTTLDAHDLVISPFGRHVYGQRRMHEEAIEEARKRVRYDVDPDPMTWVFYRDGIYALEDILGDYDPPLHSAVRASANFPFGFPLVRVRTERPLFYSPDPKLNSDEPKIVSLTDGGALSNSGMWSLYHLLWNKASEVSDIKERGVLLIVVEASKMPLYRPLARDLQSLYSTISDQAPVGQSLHRLMVERLAAAYDGRIAVVQLDLEPRKSRNVTTTWSLDAASLAKLRSTFDTRWREEKPNLRRAWKILTAGEKIEDPTDQLISGRRPPLD